MKNIISYNDWKILQSDTNHFNEIEQVVDKLNFKGYMNSVVGIDNNGNTLEVRTRSANDLSELYNYNFSECYLYKIEKVNYINYLVPEGTSPMDYDFVELSRFDQESRYIYKIRYAGIEKQKDYA